MHKGHLLLRQYGSADEAWQHVTDDGKTVAWKRAKEESLFIERHDIRVLSPLDDTYPIRLRECPDAPLILYGKGSLQVNKGKMVSVVGTRNCTERGKDLTRRFVLDLASAIPDVTIVSGLAYGIDIAAHRAAIEAGIPTLVVVGHGLDRIYPAVHRKEAVQALNNGGILTEYVSNTDPDRFNFVARDRIIAGLADAVTIIESKEKGGSLITARMAGDYDRPLFAFPGRVQDEASQGCNLLIRDQKAALIQSADDLIQAMMWQTATRPVQTVIPQLTEGMSDFESQLINILHSDEDGVHINRLMEETGKTYSALVSTLTLMEMKGWLKSMPGGIYRCIT